MSYEEAAVLFDGVCGEPVAWMRYGDPIIGQAWGETRPIPYTRELDAEEAAAKYGPVMVLVIGTQGGFESVMFGDKTFISRNVDPRRGPDYLLDGVTTTVNDPVTDGYACPKCGAAKGEHCEGVAIRHRAREKAAAQVLGLR